MSLSTVNKSLKTTTFGCLLRQRRKPRRSSKQSRPLSVATLSVPVIGLALRGPSATADTNLLSLVDTRDSGKDGKTACDKVARLSTQALAAICGHPCDFAACCLRLCRMRLCSNRLCGRRATKSHAALSHGAALPQVPMWTRLYVCLCALHVGYRTSVCLAVLN